MENNGKKEQYQIKSLLLAHETPHHTISIFFNFFHTTHFLSLLGLLWHGGLRWRVGPLGAHELEKQPMGLNNNRSGYP